MGLRRVRGRKQPIPVVFAGLWLLGSAPLALPAGAQPGSSFFTLTPCRVYDTRWGAGPLAGGFDRWLPVGGYCGIPPDASAGAFNFTAINPSGSGLLSAYPCCAPRSNVVVGLKAGSGPAGLGVIGLGSGGQIGVYLDAPFSTTAGLAVDVSGYFRPPAPVQQWQPWEQALLSPQDFTANGGDPYTEVEVEVRFTNPATGVSFLQPAYWDGEEGDPRTFRVVMAFPAGSWSWQIERCDRLGATSCLAGWMPGQGTVQVQSNTATGNPLYDRGFVRQVETVVGGEVVAVSEPQLPDGLPFTWIGDTAWAAPPREYDPPGSQAAQTSAWDAYLADREAKGFTAIQIAPAVAWQPRPADSWRPLPDPKGFSFKKKAACTDAYAATVPIPNTECWTLNGKYWKHLAAMVRKATSQGLVTVVAGVINPVGIAPDQRYPDAASAKTFAGNLRGFLGQSAVIYSPGFDDDADQVDPFTNQTRRPLMNQVGKTLITTDQTGKRRPLTNHLSSGLSNCDEYEFFARDSARWMTLFLFQSGHGGDGGANPDTTEDAEPSPPVLGTPIVCRPNEASDVENALKRSRVMPLRLAGHGYPAFLPAVNGEGPYDSTDYTTRHPNVDTRYRLRQACYESALSNAVGCSYGAVGFSLWDKPGGDFANEPRSYLSLPSVVDMTHLKTSLFGLKLQSHPEWILNNKPEHRNKMVLASAGPQLVLAYLPGDEPPRDRTSSNTIVMDGAKLPCPVCPSSNASPWTFTWLDPATNLTVDGGSCTPLASGRLQFTRPLCLQDEICDRLLRLEKTGSCSSASASPASGSNLAPPSGPKALEVWNDTSSGDGTAALYAASWEFEGRQEPVLLSPAGTGFQMSPRVDRLGSHQLVVWQADRLDGSLFGIYGAFVDSRGEVTGPFKINHYTEHDQREPSLAAGARGEALVVWASFDQDGDQGGIFGRLVREPTPGIDPLRAPFLGEEVEIAEVREGHQRNPLVVADDEGFWVAWETVDRSGLSSAVSLRRLGTDGRPGEAEVRLPAPEAEQRRLVALESPTPESVIVRWWGQDAQGRTSDSWRQPVGPRGVLGPVTPEGE